MSGHSEANPILVLALAMTDEDVCDILTWTDEPELLARPGEPDRTFPADRVAAARLRATWMAASLGRRMVH